MSDAYKPKAIGKLLHNKESENQTVTSSVSRPVCEAPATSASQSGLKMATNTPYNDSQT